MPSVFATSRATRSVPQEAEQKQGADMLLGKQLRNLASDEFDIDEREMHRVSIGAVDAPPGQSHDQEKHLIAH
jgi:hypothetical protein